LGKHAVEHGDSHVKQQHNNKTTQPSHKMVVVLTSHEIMRHGLVCAGYDRIRQERVMGSTNIARFKTKYGSTPLVCAQIWEDLQTTEIPEAHVDEMYLDLKYFLAANNWLFRYPTDEEQSGSFGKCLTTMRKWKSFYVQKIAALKEQKVSLLLGRYHRDF
jgi:hypothetical protein